MKPASIKKFDLLYLGSLAIGPIGLAINYDTILAQTDAKMTAAGVEPMGAGMLIGAMAIGIVVGLALWFLVSVARVELIKWVLAAFAAYGVIAFILGRAMDAGGGLNFVFGLVSLLMSIAAVYFLFRPDAKAWFAQKREGPDRED